MKIIDRYLSITVINATLMVLLMLIGLSVFITLIKEIGDIGTGEYGLLAALEYILFDLPQQIYSFFPIACLLGVLLGLGALANHSELIVLRAGGVSIGQIIWIILKATLFMLIIATFIGEGIAPIAEHAAETHKTLLTSNGQALNTTQGTWIRDGQNFLYIRTIIDNKNLRDISRFQFDKQFNLIDAGFARIGSYQNGRWLMEYVVDSKISNEKIVTSQMPFADWQLTVNPNLLRISAVDPQKMSLKQLQSYLNYLTANKLNTTTYVLAFWQRLLQPLATLVMVWLAIPFVFGPLRTATMGIRIVLGAFVGFSFITLNEFFGPLSTVYQIPPFIAALIPILLFAVVAWFLQRRVH